MTRGKRNLVFGCLAIALVAALWLLDIEITYERNLRHGIPADFRIRNEHRPVNWKV